MTVLLFFVVEFRFYLSHLIPIIYILEVKSQHLSVDFRRFYSYFSRFTAFSSFLLKEGHVRKNYWCFRSEFSIHTSHLFFSLLNFQIDLMSSVISRRIEKYDGQYLSFGGEAIFELGNYLVSELTCRLIIFNF